ncbi:UNVERIFIED_ORG: hypothetical protein QE446_001013 [Rhizobium sp. SORGH_AS260]|nr:hypothetical protein [Rhizobium sp. RAS22]MDP9730787.1 hypothetical protein [Rhizobium sp. SORGH_AS_0285]MDP9753156.1 hypothetical protein [Rhizobium sp. SORGH_AS_0260]MDP9772079.1 hypothetical protein [Rhizobium sp. SORGH_AS_0755]MDR6080127.1 hypothetical protein [Agrobacterium sp. SORGH_AS_0440]MDR6191597.1 hypothetical protein [Agrobacterium pusense]
MQRVPELTNTVAQIFCYFGASSRLATLQSG